MRSLRDRFTAKARIDRTGNSQGIRFSKPLIEDAGLGDDVESPCEATRWLLDPCPGIDKLSTDNLGSLRAETWSWDDMIEEFRVLGGTADNVVQRDGPRGHGLFPIDPSKPVDIHVPGNLLIPTRWVREDGPDLVIDEASGLDARTRAFFTRYQRAFSWGRDGRRDALSWFEQLEALPEAIKHCLREKLGVTLPQEKSSAGDARARFIATRNIQYRNELVLMPVVELINHAPHAAGYDTRDGIRVQGLHTDEVFICYGRGDSLMRFFSHGFVCDEKRAFGLPLVFQDVFGATLAVRHDVMKWQETQGVGALLPTVENTEHRIVISHVLLGNTTGPRIPRSVFRRILPQFSSEQADEAFQRIAGTNIRILVNVLEQLDSHDAPFCRQLRAAIRLQLLALSDSYGVRDLNTLSTTASQGQR